MKMEKAPKAKTINGVTVAVASVGDDVQALRCASHLRDCAPVGSHIGVVVAGDGVLLLWTPNPSYTESRVCAWIRDSIEATS